MIESDFSDLQARRRVARALYGSAGLDDPTPSWAELEASLARLRTATEAGLEIARLANAYARLDASDEWRGKPLSTPICDLIIAAADVVERQEKSQTWLCVYKIEDDAPVWFLGPPADALKLYETVRLSWSEVYLCRVLDGPKDRGMELGVILAPDESRRFAREKAIAQRLRQEDRESGRADRVPMCGAVREKGDPEAMCRRPLGHVGAHVDADDRMWPRVLQATATEVLHEQPDPQTRPTHTDLMVPPETIELGIEPEELAPRLREMEDRLLRHGIPRAPTSVGYPGVDVGFYQSQPVRTRIEPSKISPEALEHFRASQRALSDKLQKSMEPVVYGPGPAQCPAACAAGRCDRIAGHEGEHEVGSIRWRS